MLSIAFALTTPALAADEAGGGKIARARGSSPAHAHRGLDLLGPKNIWPSKLLRLAAAVDGDAGGDRKPRSP
jgi:hypothetical protein